MKTWCRIHMILLLAFVVLSLSSTGFAQATKATCLCPVEAKECIPADGFVCGASAQARDLRVYNCSYEDGSVAKPPGRGACSRRPVAYTDTCGSACSAQECTKLKKSVASAKSCEERLSEDGQAECVVAAWETVKLKCIGTPSGAGNDGVQVTMQDKCTACNDKTSCLQATCGSVVTAAKCDKNNPSTVPQCLPKGQGSRPKCAWRPATIEIDY